MEYPTLAIVMNVRVGFVLFLGIALDLRHPLHNFVAEWECIR